MAKSIEQWREAAKHFEFEGKKISYWTGGSGRPLLLVHGYPTAARDWAPTWDALATEHSLIAPDMFGFGLSDKPRSGYSIHQQADMHLALLNHLGVSEFDAVVHDYGVSVGQELLARQREGSGAAGLGKMIFLNGGIFPDLHRPVPMQKLGVSPLGFLLGRLIGRASFGRSFSAVFGPDTQPSTKELDDFWSLMTEQDGHRIMHKLLHYIADRRRHEARWVGVLKDVQDRIGLINGALDPVSGEHAFRRWTEYLPQAKAYLLTDVGHYPHVEAPDRVAAMALEWLR